MRFREQEVLTGHKFADVLGMKLRLRALGSSPQFFFVFFFLFLKPPALAALLLALSNIFSQLSFSFFFHSGLPLKNGYLLCQRLFSFGSSCRTLFTSHFPLAPWGSGCGCVLLWWFCGECVVYLTQ